ncbi:MAG: carotenoid 1,2-hydratase [Rhodobacterales bacterium]|nr:carotenoid 1,2-hydratase [Rhodobacterales bacterium]
MIGFVGSVFSPWYAWSGRGDPTNHCCLNVVTSGLRHGRFSMTDRGRGALRQSADTLQVGPSRMHWTGSELVVEVNDWGAPPAVTPVRGRLILTPRALTGEQCRLTPDGSHLWWPIAPVAHIRVELSPGPVWEGHGYWDANFGIRPLEEDFRFWTWGRYPAGDRTYCFYDAIRRDGSTLALALAAGADGSLRPVTAPPLTPLPRSGWALRRETRADPGHRPRMGLSLLQAPFYSRALVQARIEKQDCLGMHEALDLDRYRQPWLKPMLALRVPRRARWD